MKKISVPLMMLGIISLLTMPILPAHAADVVVGMDIPGTGNQNLSPDARIALLNQLHDSGVKVIRSWVLDNNEDQIDFIRKAYAMGMKVHLTIPIHYRIGAIKRPYVSDLSWVYPNYLLSDADPQRTAAAFADTLNKLESSGIVLVGFEVGNEINNAPFNGDFIIHPKDSSKRSKNMGLEDLKHDPEGQKIAAGYRTYIEVLKAVRAVRDHSKLNRNTPLLLGGLADSGDERSLPNSRVNSVSINATIQMLREFGIDNIVDAYGIHTYPTVHRGDPHVADYRWKALARTALAECAPVGTSGKPCWITEWGFKNESDSCPSDESERAPLVREMMKDFRSYVRQGRLLGLFYYTWFEYSPDKHHHDPFSVYRCGSLTESGKIAIDSHLVR